MDKKQTFVTAAARASDCKVHRSSQNLYLVGWLPIEVGRWSKSDSHSV
jgi:hypothetical protein